MAEVRGSAGRRAAGLLCLEAVLMMAVPGGSASSQEEPGARLPGADLRLPAIDERVLSNGARLMVVPGHEVPLVSVTLVLPGGRAADPAERLGLADLTARLLVQGTEARPAREVEGRLGALGASLEATAGTDWTTVSLRVGPSELADALELMAEVVLRPSFPEGALHRAREAALSTAEATRTNAAALAERAFLREVYDGHPYGPEPTPGTLGRIDRAALLDFHETRYRPGGALFVVAGAVEPDRLASLLERSFGSWEPGTPPAAERALPPLRRAPRIVLVHRPETPGAVLRLGHTLPRGDHADWTALQLLDRVVAGRPLPAVFPGAPSGGGPPARIRLQRRIDRGLLEVSAEVPVERAGAAVGELREQLFRLREDPISIEVLRDARGFLAESLPLRLETPEQVAGEWMAGRLLGGPGPVQPGWRDAVRALDAGHLREAARRHLQPAELVVVVVGDAGRLHGQLAGFGDPVVVDAEGEAVDVSPLLPRNAAGSMDASGLVPGTAEYRVRVAGREVGSVRRTLEPGETPGTLVYRGVADVAGEVLTQSVTFTVPGFAPLAAEARAGRGGVGPFLSVRVEEGRLKGVVRDAAGRERPLDREPPPGAILADMAELVPWIAGPAPGSTFALPVLQAGTGDLVTVTWTFGGVEEITVPAGTFRARRIEVGGPDPATVWVAADAPRVLLRIRSGAGPVVQELVSSTLGGP